MRSSEGLYFSRLDHVRAVAAYIVFVWHFIHLPPFPNFPLSAAPPFPMALLAQGHAGVALFMTLSGYLFAKIANGGRINYPNFLWNRAIRLAPLLLVCLLGWYILGHFGGNPVTLAQIFKGVLLPAWPSVTWSLTVELHFYILFPFLLWAANRFSSYALLIALMASIALRSAIWLNREVQSAAYWTIVGSIDQFLLGMFFALTPMPQRIRGWLAAAAGALFLVFWQYFNEIGGFYDIGGYPSKTWLWIIIPTFQALAFGSFIAWYDNCSLRIPRWIDKPLSKIGEWSYSIYMLHLFLQFFMVTNAGSRLGEVGFWPALAFATFCFVAFLPIPAASYRWIEKPPLRFRRPYITRTIAEPEQSPWKQSTAV